MMQRNTICLNTIKIANKLHLLCGFHSKRRFLSPCLVRTVISTSSTTIRRSDKLSCPPLTYPSNYAWRLSRVTGVKLPFRCCSNMNNLGPVNEWNEESWGKFSMPELFSAKATKDLASPGMAVWHFKTCYALLAKYQLDMYQCGVRSPVFEYQPVKGGDANWKGTLHIYWPDELQFVAFGNKKKEIANGLSLQAVHWLRNKGMFDVLIVLY